MLEIRIRLDAADAIKALAGIKNGFPRAAVRALNRSLTTVRAEATRAIAADTGLASRDVRDSIEILKPTFDRLAGEVVVTGRRIPLIKFRARQTPRGVSYRLPGGRSVAPSAFIATMRSGHRGVFRRRTPKRLPIDELRGPSLPRVLARAKIADAMRKLGEATLLKNLTHEVEFLLLRRQAS